MRASLYCFLLTMLFCSGTKAAGLLLTVQSTNTTCGARNGSMIVSASGGTSPYQYSWNGNLPQANGNFLFFSAGTYYIHVTDINGLFADTTIILTNQFISPVAGLANIVSPSACNSTDAGFTVTGSGGVPPYTFSIDETNFQASPDFRNLSAGFYHYSVMDANGCASEKDAFHSVTLDSKCAIHHNGIILSYTCSPFRSEVQLINVSGGTPPYSYSLDGINYQPGNSFYPRPAGMYTVHVKDAAGQVMVFTIAVVDYCYSYFTARKQYHASALR